MYKLILLLINPDCVFWRWRVMARNMNNTHVICCVLNKLKYGAASSYLFCVETVGDGIVCLGIQL